MADQAARAFRMRRGRNAEAVDTLHAYIGVFEAEVGHLHPDVSVGYHTLAVALFATGKTGEGEQALRTALEIIEKTVGDEHPLYASPLSDLSGFEAERGKHEVAIALARKAAAIREAQGAQPLSAAANRLHIAQWLGELGKFEEARVIWARQLAILGADDEAIAELRTLLAETNVDRPQKDLAAARFVLAGFVEVKTPGSAEARALAQTALRGFEATSKGASADEVRVWLAEH